MALSRFLMAGTYVMVEGEKVQVPHTTIEIAFFELALLFGGTNIPKSRKDKSPVLPDDAPEGQVREYLKTLPTAVVIELWNALGKACPGWGPKVDEGEADPKN